MKHLKQKIADKVFDFNETEQHIILAGLEMADAALKHRKTLINKIEEPDWMDKCSETANILYSKAGEYEYWLKKLDESRPKEP